MAHTVDDVLTLVDAYGPTEIQSYMRFLIEMKSKGASSSAYQGNQVVFRSMSDLQDEIRLWRAAWLCATTGERPKPIARGFRILDGWGLRDQTGDER